MHRANILGNIYFHDREEAPKISHPTANDGADIAHLVQQCDPLDPNSTYSYLLLCTHFSKTCVVARMDDEIAGFISAYVKPGTNDTLFIWQVAVSPDARRRGLANYMLRDLLSRRHLRNVRYVETTINPSNEASKNLFVGLSREIGSPCEIKTGFSKCLFKREHHEDEYLFRIGPINHKEDSHESGYLQSHGVGGAVLRPLVSDSIYEG